MFVPANAHLGVGGRVGVGVGLQQERGGLDVVLLGGDVQRWQADPRPRVVLQQHGHHTVVALLQSHRQRREPVLHDTTVKRRPEMSMGLVDPWVGSGLVEIFQFLVGWVGLGWVGSSN